jgi:hypothetical protein
MKFICFYLLDGNQELIEMLPSAHGLCQLPRGKGLAS